jgi:hypothetical protein
MNAGSSVTIAPLNTSAPECSITDSGFIRHALAIVVAYIARMKCVCWMPFGNPVVPLVYMIVSRSSPPTTVSSADPGALATQAPKSRSLAGRSPSGRPASASAGLASPRPGSTASSIGSRSTDATSKRAFASVNNEAIAGPFNNVDSGTMAAPSFAHAHSSVSRSMPFGSSVATRSPRRTPRAASACAVRLTRTSKSPHVKRTSATPEGATTARWPGRYRACRATSRPSARLS